MIEQAKPETVKKVCDLVRKQLALPDDSKVDGESKFATLGADSLDTVTLQLYFNFDLVEAPLAYSLEIDHPLVLLPHTFFFNLLWIS